MIIDGKEAGSNMVLPLFLITVKNEKKLILFAKMLDNVAPM